MWACTRDVPRRGRELQWDGTGWGKGTRLCEGARIATLPKVIREPGPECGRKESQASSLCPRVRSQALSLSFWVNCYNTTYRQMMVGAVGLAAALFLDLAD